MKNILSYKAFLAIAVIFVILFILGAYLLCGMVEGDTVCLLWPHIELKDIQTLIKDSGPWGVIVSMGLMILHSLVPFPSEFITLANGMVYGVFWGTVISWTGAMMGAFLAFFLARRLGQAFVYRYLEEKKMRKFMKVIEMQGPEIIFLCRFIPVVSFNLLNYVSGLARISWWTFAWTTGIGILPITILMVTVGDRIYELPMEIWLLVILAGLSLWGLIHYLYSKHFSAE